MITQTKTNEQRLGVNTDWLLSTTGRAGENTRIRRSYADSVSFMLYRFQMSTSFLVIVEFGAQKQRISLDTSSSYEDVLQQIYSLFKIDASYRSKYVLQRQDPLKFGSFVTVDEQSFRDDVRRHAANRSQQSVMRLRLVPSSSKSAVRSRWTFDVG